MGTSQAATTAGMPLPSDMPIMGMLVSVGRRLSGDVSAVNAITLGSTPPRPMPVMNRRMPSCSRFSASRQASDISAYRRVPTTMTRLRPKRSPMLPRNMAPNIMPSRLAEMT